MDYAERARRLRAQGRASEGRELLEKNAEASEPNVAQLVERGACLRAEGNDRAAIALLTHACARDGANAHAFQELGRCLHSAGALIDATRLLRKAYEQLGDANKDAGGANDAADIAASLAACLIDRGTAAKAAGQPELANQLYK